MNNQGLMDNEKVDEIFIPGGGISKRILQTSKERSIPTTLLLKFCSEGDNSVDGLELTGYLEQLVGLRETSSRLKVPSSWRHLFGAPPPTQMFW